MKKEKEMDVVFLLDRSGSMGGIEKDTIGGYNSYIKEQKDKNIKVTTVLFDHEYEMLTNREDIKKIDKLDNKTYYVRGSTALLDAIGKTIKYMDKVKNKVLFTITTDGLENSSREFSKEQIKEMIEGHKDWEFMYIGANIDSYSEGCSIGIKEDNIANYEQSSRGVSKLFKSIGKASTCMYEEACVGTSWKQELDNYIESNK